MKKIPGIKEKTYYAELCSSGSALIYDNNILFAFPVFSKNGNKITYHGVIYEFGSACRADNYIKANCQITEDAFLLLVSDRPFCDTGHAIEWCLSEMSTLYDDPFYIVMNMTETGENMTEERAKEIIDIAITEGWRIPRSFTAKDFIELYNDCNGEEEK